MKIDSALKTRLQASFAPLKAVAAEKAFPPPLSLASKLEQSMPTKDFIGAFPVSQAVCTHFVTAAVDCWLRAVHSFLTSAALTEASPVWSSVSGYYASHYSVRAFAHLLGYFQLYHNKRIVKIELTSGGKHVCNADKKQGSDREHKFYWKLVKQDLHFAADPLFRLNESAPNVDASDAGHRERLNYADHIGQTPIFRSLDSPTLRSRIQFISDIQFSTPPIPKKSRAPDVESVQVIAYHRIVTFRRFLDEVLGGTNRFWSVHRNPAWASGMMDFQLTEQGALTAFN